jgi:hypothetical protein
MKNVSFFEPQITVKQNTTVFKGGMSPKPMRQIIMLHCGVNRHWSLVLNIV